jgi:hypothetical protein
VIYGRRPPRCQACKRDVALDRLPEYAAGGGFTSGCGARMSVRAAPPLARQLLPGAAYVLNEMAVSEPTLAAEPVMFQCLACGGGLRVDGRDRTVTCAYCKGQNYLPDGLWLRFHPVPQAQTIFLVADLDAAAVEELRIRGDNGAARVAAGTTSTERLDGLVGNDDWEVRQAVAANPNTSVSALERLASDDDGDVAAAALANPTLPAAARLRALSHEDYEVRAAAVRNPATPLSAVRERVASGEEDSDVLAAVFARPDLDLPTLEVLARHRDYEVRARVANHPMAPPALLLRLAADDDSDVQAALLRRLELPREVLLRLEGHESEPLQERVREHASFAPIRAERARILRVAVAGSLVFLVVFFGALILLE